MAVHKTKPIDADTPPEEAAVIEAVQKSLEAPVYKTTTKTIWHKAQGTAAFKCRCYEPVPTGEINADGEDVYRLPPPPVRYRCETPEAAEARYRRDEKIPAWKITSQTLRHDKTTIPGPVVFSLDASREVAEGLYREQNPNAVEVKVEECVPVQVTPCDVVCPTLVEG